MDTQKALSDVSLSIIAEKFSTITDINADASDRELIRLAKEYLSAKTPQEKKATKEIFGFAAAKLYSEMLEEFLDGENKHPIDIEIMEQSGFVPFFNKCIDMKQLEQKGQNPGMVQAVMLQNEMGKIKKQYISLEKKKHEMEKTQEKVKESKLIWQESKGKEKEPEPEWAKTREGVIGHLNGLTARWKELLETRTSDIKIREKRKQEMNEVEREYDRIIKKYLPDIADTLLVDKNEWPIPVWYRDAMLIMPDGSVIRDISLNDKLIDEWWLQNMWKPGLLPSTKEELEKAGFVEAPKVFGEDPKKLDDEKENRQETPFVQFFKGLNSNTKEIIRSIHHEARASEQAARNLDDEANKALIEALSDARGTMPAKKRKELDKLIGDLKLDAWIKKVSDIFR